MFIRTVLLSGTHTRLRPASSLPDPLRTWPALPQADAMLVIYTKKVPRAQRLSRHSAKRTGTPVLCPTRPHAHGETKPVAAARTPRLPSPTPGISETKPDAAVLVPWRIPNERNRSRRSHRSTKQSQRRWSPTAKRTAGVPLEGLSECENTGVYKQVPNEIV
jgi:hypothetical protein